MGGLENWRTGVADRRVDTADKIKVVGTFHVPFTRKHCKFTPADGTMERACYFCRLYQDPDWDGC